MSTIPQKGFSYSNRRARVLVFSTWHLNDFTLSNFAVQQVSHIVSLEETFNDFQVNIYSLSILFKIIFIVLYTFHPVLKYQGGLQKKIGALIPIPSRIVLFLFYFILQLQL